MNMRVKRYRTTSAFEHLKPDVVLTVYHGTSPDQCVEFLERGVDATKEHSRIHNQGRERGLYVTPHLGTAFDFGNWVLELHIPAKYLYPTQRWGLGSQRKNLKGSSLLDPYVKSFRPLVSFQLNEKIEPQAMFIGYVPVKSIVRVHYATPGTVERSTMDVQTAKSVLKVSGPGIMWDLSMSSSDIIDAITKEHNLEQGEIVDILRDYDLDMFAHEQRMPRKLKLRLAMHLHKLKNTASLNRGNSYMSSLQAIAKELSLRGVSSVMVLAGDDKIKVTTKLNFPKADMLMINEMEGTTLRGRTVLGDPTKTKICNSISRTLGRVNLYGHFPQRQGIDTIYRFSISAKPEPGKQYLLSELGKNDTVVKMQVQLVDKTSRKPVYQLSDITSGEVEIVEVK